MAGLPSTLDIQPLHLTWTTFKSCPTNVASIKKIVLLFSPEL